VTFYGFAGYPYTGIKRMVLEYMVYFPPGFKFVIEGKLPGVWGKDATKAEFDCGGITPISSFFLNTPVF